MRLRLGLLGLTCALTIVMLFVLFLLNGTPEKGRRANVTVYPDVRSALESLTRPREKTAFSQKPDSPILAWAGQRVVVANDWSQNGLCPWAESGAWFLVRYESAGPGELLEGTDPNHQIVSVFADEGAVRNSGCTSHALYSSHDQGRIDLKLTVVSENGAALSNSEEQIIYYMKLEDTTLGLDEPGNWVGGEGADYSRVQVRGWIISFLEDGSIQVETFDWTRTSPAIDGQEKEFICGDVLPPNRIAAVAALPTEARETKPKVQRSRV